MNVEEYSDDVPEKHKSLLKLRQEKLERAQMRKQAKLEHATLPDFIRFVDYMAVEALVGIAITTTFHLYEELCKARKSGVFETTIRFNEKEALPPRKSSKVWSTVLLTSWSIQLAR